MSRIRLISSERYTYLHDPDGNMIELTYHPLGMEDSRGNKVEVMPGGLRWSLRPGLVASGDRGEER